MKTIYQYKGKRYEFLFESLAKMENGEWKEYITYQMLYDDYKICAREKKDFFEKFILEPILSPEQIFEEIKKIEDLGYCVILSSDSCQVYDNRSKDRSMIIDADFKFTMYENAVDGLTGLYEKLKKEREIII